MRWKGRKIQQNEDKKFSKTEQKKPGERKAKNAA